MQAVQSQQQPPPPTPSPACSERCVARGPAEAKDRTSRDCGPQEAGETLRQPAHLPPSRPGIPWRWPNIWTAGLLASRKTGTQAWGSLGLIVDPDEGLKQGQLGGGGTSKVRRTEAERGETKDLRGENVKENTHFTHSPMHTDLDRQPVSQTGAQGAKETWVDIRGQADRRKQKE